MRDTERSGSRNLQSGLDPLREPESLPFHPAAKAFPRLPDDQLAVLAADIGANGLLEPLTLWLGQDRTYLLDGRNRLEACQRAGVTPTVHVYDGQDPVAYVVARNLQRRHLTAGQKAAIAAELLPQFEYEAKQRMRAGVAQLDPVAGRPEGAAREQAAALVGSSGRALGRYRRVSKADPDLADRVREGELALDRAERLVQQQEAATQTLPTKSKGDSAAFELPAVADSLEQLAEKGWRFGTIYADPPWLYANDITRGAATDHYTGMNLEELRELPVPQLAANDAYLHLWATVPLLPQALTLLEAWGFTYKSQFVWAKESLGMGNYWRVNHEILLLGTRGNAMGFADRGLPSWAVYPREEHSRKPEAIRQLIERASPGPYLELFARRRAPGWTVWGNEVGHHQEDEGFSQI